MSELDALRKDVLLKMVRMNLRQARMFRGYKLYGYARLSLNEALAWRNLYREFAP